MKQPWEMTRKEWFIKQRDELVNVLEKQGRLHIAARARKLTLESPTGSESNFGKIIEGHKFYVEEAVKANKPVPAEVLADYPDLTKEA